MPRIIIEDDKCKSCKLCMTACPKQIISIDTDRLNNKGFHPIVVKEMDKCIGCAFCATICPDSVITVEK